MKKILILLIFVLCLGAWFYSRTPEGKSAYENTVGQDISYATPYTEAKSVFLEFDVKSKEVVNLPLSINEEKLYHFKGSLEGDSEDIVFRVLEGKNIAFETTIGHELEEKDISLEAGNYEIEILIEYGSGTADLSWEEE